VDVVPKKSTKTRVTPDEPMEGRSAAKGKSTARNAPPTQGGKGAPTYLQWIGQRAKGKPQETRRHSLLSTTRSGSSGIARCNVAVRRDVGRSRCVRNSSNDSSFRYLVSFIRGPPKGSHSVDPKWEPGAGNPLAGFCPGGGPKGPSLPGLRARVQVWCHAGTRHCELHQLVRFSCCASVRPPVEFA
jgi:hypothetical protein